MGDLIPAFDNAFKACRNDDCGYHLRVSGRFLQIAMPLNQIVGLANIVGHVFHANGREQFVDLRNSQVVVVRDDGRVVKRVRYRAVEALD